MSRCSFLEFEPVRNGRSARKMQQATKPLRRRDVGLGTGTQQTPDERKEPKLVRGNPALRRIAAKTFRVAAGHEVPGTGSACGRDQELAVGTNRLKPMVLDDDRFS